jgi:hypothetical protein
MSRPGDIVNDLRQAALICRERGMAITAQVIEDGAVTCHVHASQDEFWMRYLRFNWASYVAEVAG